jgi:hypothetical protein
MGDLPVNQNEHPLSKRHHPGLSVALHPIDLNPLNMGASDAETSTNSLISQFAEIMNISVSTLLGCFYEGEQHEMVTTARMQFVASAEAAVSLVDAVYVADIKEERGLMSRDERHYIFGRASKTLIITLVHKMRSCIDSMKNQNEGCILAANELSAHYDCNDIVNRLNTSTAALELFNNHARLFAIEWMRAFMHHYALSLD